MATKKTSAGTGADRKSTEAFEELIENHAREIQLFLYKLCGNHHDAEELAQDVFVKAFRKLATLREQGAGRRWLYTIAVNHFHDWVKPKRRAVLRCVLELEEQAVEGRGSDDPPHEAMTRELSRFLDGEVRRLPERQRTVVLLFSATGFDYAEIGRALGISPDAVKMSLFHARERLREQVERFLAR